MDVLSAALLLALGGAAVLSHWITASVNESLGAPMDSGREFLSDGGIMAVFLLLLRLNHL